MSMRKLLVAISAFAATTVMAQPQQPAISVEFKAFVERFATAKDGAIERELKPVETNTVVPGDRLVYVLTYRNNSTQPVTNIVVNNPMAANIEFMGEESPGAEMSVDGGKTYGPITQLKVSGSGGVQPARRSDVTHIRWRIPGAVAPKTAGQVTFKARLK